MDSQQFYHPNDYRHNQQDQYQRPFSDFSHDGGFDPAAAEWSTSTNKPSHSTQERGRQPGSGVLGSIFRKPVARPASEVGNTDHTEPEPPRERTKLRKRSSSRVSGSKLGVLAE